MKKAITFINATKKDFSWKWDGQLYTFKAGEKFKFEEAIARHFARHLAIRELNEISGKQGLVTPQNLDPMMAKFLVEEDAIEAEDETKLEMEIMNEKPKRGRPKKVENERGASNPEESLPEEEFEGLTE